MISVIRDMIRRLVKSRKEYLHLRNRKHIVIHILLEEDEFGKWNKEMAEYSLISQRQRNHIYNTGEFKLE